MLHHDRAESFRPGFERSETAFGGIVFVYIVTPKPRYYSWRAAERPPGTSGNHASHPRGAPAYTRARSPQPHCTSEPFADQWLPSLCVEAG